MLAAFQAFENEVPSLAAAAAMAQKERRTDEELAADGGGGGGGDGSAAAGYDGERVCCVGHVRCVRRRVL